MQSYAFLLFIGTCLLASGKGSLNANDMWCSYQSLNNTYTCSDVCTYMWAFIMGVAEIFFIAWHTFTLRFPHCFNRSQNYKQAFWALRILHWGAIVLLLLMIYMCLRVWPKLPSIVCWSTTAYYLFISMVFKFATLVYWAVELAVNVYQCLCCRHRNE